MPFHHSRGLALHYEVLGTGAPVLLIHGFTNFGMVWANQAAALVHAGYQAIMPDLAGHGLSAAAEHPTTVEDLAADMVALLDTLGHEQAAVCGLSLGGMVAQQMAVDFPHRPSALVIAASRAENHTQAMQQVVAGWVAQFEGPEGPLGRLKTTWPILLNEAFRNSAAGEAALDLWRQVLAQVEGHSLANIARGMAHFSAAEALPDVLIPTCVIAGEQDQLIPADVTHRIAELIPDAEFAVIPGGGHICSLDSPAPFNRLLLEFLARHNRAG